MTRKVSLLVSFNIRYCKRVVQQIWTIYHPRLYPRHQQLWILLGWVLFCIISCLSLHFLFYIIYFILFAGEFLITGPDGKGYNVCEIITSNQGKEKMRGCFGLFKSKMSELGDGMDD